jgi:hypothetical protein
MATPTPHNWRTAIVNMAIAALVVAIALHVAAELVRSVAPELIALSSAAVLCYVLVAIARYRRSRW